VGKEEDGIREGDNIGQNPSEPIYLEATTKHIEENAIPSASGSYNRMPCIRVEEDYYLNDMHMEL